jgi:two-component sensor histidine kinase
VQAEEKVRQLNADLEQRVAERTGALEKANKELSQALRDKEVLLMEVNHRVKNNLQVITNLLSLQARTMDDPILIEAFNAGLSRVFTMARVHEALYRSEHAGMLDLHDYLQGLVQDVSSFHQSDGFTPVVKLHANASLKLPLDKITPIALIVNELLTNAFRHGFKNRQSGAIEIDLQVEPGSARLEIADDGVGLAPERRRSSKSLGLRLVELMVGQIEGTLEITARSTGGTRAVVAWPLLETAEA